MSRCENVTCVLCQTSVQTEVTGALSTKENVTAHQNCLLFSSGLFCRDTPEFDNLFGFAVEDVKKEVTRGKKLICKKCRKKGATAGCEVKRCKKSYHHPCAVQDGAKMVEEPKKGTYWLLCFQHYQESHEKKKNLNGNASSSSSPHPSEAGPSKTEGNVSLESLSSDVHLLYCDNNPPSSHTKKTNGDSTAERQSVYCSDSDLSSSTSSFPVKRQLSFRDKNGEPLSKRNSESMRRIMTDDSSDPDEEPDADVAIFGPLESDLEGSPETPSVVIHSSQYYGIWKKKQACIKSPTGSPSGKQTEVDFIDGISDEDESDAESQSLLPPVKNPSPPLQRSVETQTVITKDEPLSQTAFPVDVFGTADDEGSGSEQSPVHHPDQHNPPPSVLEQNAASPSLCPDHFKHYSVVDSPVCSISSAPPETISTPEALPSEPAPSINSTSFWESCTAAGCTQAIFTDFIDEMKQLSSRIQSGQASKDDSDLALAVMEASGKLTELVTKQQKELQRKQAELQKAAAAMEEVVSALRR